jgi:GTP-binding protein EngB required for normal cell division
MALVSNIAQGVASGVANYFSSAQNFNILGQDKDILNIGNALNSIFVNRKDISIPKLAVVGSQSSGKSSILNSILGMDILPTGSNMVTRGPLQLELVQSVTDVKAVFGEYIDSEWVEIKSIKIQYPDPTMEQKYEISSIIKSITNQYAGEGMNITDKPIYLRIYSPNIPNLSLVDLPGLTMVACTDKGQPKDIKDKIRTLLHSYIDNPETIILAVMPARTDIEADIALDLIKECDSEGKRTIGILTKLDLMNEGTDVTNYLENRVSKDLQLKLGYFGIKNRSKMDMSSMNVLDGLKSEHEFFKNHRIYSNNKYKDNLGIPSLCKNLSSVLVKSLKRNLPTILEKINSELIINEKELEKLGNPIPQDDHMKAAFVHKTISKLSRSYISILDDRGKNINTGRNIKNHFNQFRIKIRDLKPFINYSDKYILNAIANCEGNHMSFPSPPIEVLEQLIKDIHKRPMNLIFDPSYKCVQSIMTELSELLEILIKEDGVERFPNFYKLISQTFMNEILMPSLNNLHKVIDEEIKCQENYVWTEDIRFMDALNRSTENNVEIMKTLASHYFESIVYVVQDIIPKKIMFHMVSFSQKELSSKLYNQVKDKNLTELLCEYDDIHEKRSNLEKTVKELQGAKSLIHSIM